MKLSRGFYLRDALSVARELPGAILTHAAPEGVTRGRIVETEAYMGPGDPASHSASGIPTPRTRVLYGQGGTAYIYVIYGLHCCLNITVNVPGVPQAVLIRALEPVEGLNLMCARRGMNDVRKLCNGPGKLCAAMGITRDMYGWDLCGDRLYLEEARGGDPIRVVASPRINIASSGEAAAFPWRFTLRDSPFLSAPVALSR